MSEHVVYACSCLNIKIHLASKYSLANHTSERQQYWFEQENPAMEGWHLSLGMGAIVVAYSSLIETCTNSTHSWMTVGCLNCDTKNVYSIQNKVTNRSSSASLSHGQSDEFVVIHKDTIFGSQLDDVRNDDQFSDIFDIKLSNSTSSISLAHSDEIPDKLRAQHQELYQVLEKALDKMRLASEVRIEQWKKVEMERLEEDSKRAKEESKKLWRKVLSVNQSPTTHQTNDKDAITMAAKPVSAEDGISHDIQQQSTSSLSSSSVATTTPVPMNSNTPSSMTTSQQESKRSQGVRFMDHTNDSKTATLPSSYRRSSLSLSHSAIVNGVQQDDPQADRTHLTNVPGEQDQNKDASSDEEDMFDLDEELDLNDDGNDDTDTGIRQQQQESSTDEINGANKESSSVDGSPHASDSSVKEKTKGISKDGGSMYGSSWVKRKKLTGKYIEDFGNGSKLDEQDASMEGADGLEDLSTSISKYATSMPINIHSAMANFVPPQDNNVNNPAEEDPNVFSSNDQIDKDRLQLPSPSRPSVITTSFSFAPKKATSSSTSFVGYDFSFSDRALSKQFPDYNPGRRKSVATVSVRQHPQLDALIEKSSLDTRSMKK